MLCNVSPALHLLTLMPIKEHSQLRMLLSPNQKCTWDDECLSLRAKPRRWATGRGGIDPVHHPLLSTEKLFSRFLKNMMLRLNLESSKK